MNNSLIARKAAQRRTARQARQREAEPDRRSRQATDRVRALESYQRASTVCWYLDCRSELRTRSVMPDLLAGQQRIVIPYCRTELQPPELGLWRLEQMDELQPGAFDILEPPTDSREDPQRLISAAELDAVIVPGVAFSRGGARLGNGHGYYDRLLARVRRDCVRIGLCYEAQLLTELAIEAHDESMHWVVTEAATYPAGEARQQD